MEPLSSQEMTNDIDAVRAVQDAADGGAAPAPPAPGPFTPAAAPGSFTPAPGVFVPNPPPYLTPPSVVGAGVATPIAPAGYEMSIRHLNLVSTPISSFAHVPLDLVLIHLPRLPGLH